MVGIALVEVQGGRPLARFEITRVGDLATNGSILANVFFGLYGRNRIGPEKRVPPVRAEMFCFSKIGQGLRTEIPFLASTIVRTDVAQRVAPLWKKAALAAFKLLAARGMP